MSERKISEALRACVAGLGAVSARGAAVTAFQAGGHRLLDETARKAARHAVDWAAKTMLGTLLPGGIGQITSQGIQRALNAAQIAGGGRLSDLVGKVLASSPVASAIERVSQAAEGAAGHAVEQVADQVMISGSRGTKRAMLRILSGSASDQFYTAARRAAAAGALVDGINSGINATQAYQRGEITGRQAVVRVSLDAATGAIAASTGVALGASAIVVLGGLSAPALFVVGATGAVGTKRALNWLFE